MAKMPKIKGVKDTLGPHGIEKKFGMGDYYGTGFRNPVGRMRSDTVDICPLAKSQMGKPPKSVV